MIGGCLSAVGNESLLDVSTEWDLIKGVHYKSAGDTKTRRLLSDLNAVNRQAGACDQTELL